MLTSMFNRLAHVAAVACGATYVIAKTNIEVIKIVAKEFAPSRNKEETETDDIEDDIEDGLTDAEKAAADDQATNDAITEFWKSYMNIKPPRHED